MRQTPSLIIIGMKPYDEEIFGSWYTDTFDDVVAEANNTKYI